ncbi:glycosyltransferase family 59 protein [Trichoderma atroviride IMI 206040]|uniref:Dol-P-Glc:Glc(2)Man(9)GlcNAc(2)-PP-Dol alpha-1,2-glucosyltransferase n=1 Tax=Hypocrea atroviridis (strain ATCC 20476 / IMI 206040) TaxID=452589 RepID=G9NGE4_HYPAI|nr:glycosyltransferase family 59 protein [Trichoderma atroviride IMI 206040]EHK50356.1 glycosyltransferase family 59 protein [Trichoderma atroviride IMI 206040]
MASLISGAPDALGTFKFASWAAGAVPIAFVLHVFLFRTSGNSAGNLAFLWLGVVSETVPEPYLDEVFHIPQAQRYCEGRFLEWDDKITTPPGFGLIASYACDAKTLRATNAVGIIVLSYTALLCRKAIEARLHQAHSSTSISSTSQYAAHTALNIALFPLLFFFSGLYYTDVVSTAVVLVSFLNHLHRIGRDQSSFLSDVTTIVLGLCSLTMRQTNVFWVVVFMGGLEAVHAVKSLRPKVVVQPYMTSLSEQLLFFFKRCLIVAALCNPLRLIRQIWPYVTVLAAFAGFVAWNGGVVLGDKSNHVATIHAPQMLYIWAFFGFFSLPLFVPYAFLAIDAIRSVFISRKDKAVPRKSKTASQPALSLPLKLFTFIFNNRLLWPLYLAATFVLSGLVVRFNTIIHPFTLADNRHYMFYVFRYTIRRAPWIRYFLILPYTLSRWLVWGTLSGCTNWISGAHKDACSAYYYSSRPSPFTCDPFVVADVGAPTSKNPQEETKKNTEQDPLLFSTEPAPTSTGLIFLLATSLSLITAPLVEPRYFIIPWVIWRLLVPAWRLHDHQEEENSLFDGASSTSPWGKLIKFCRGYDVRLILETIWFILINAITGYIFLSKPYVWKAEDGSILDGGRLQRFMW